MLSHIQLFVTPWTVAHEAPLSMGFFSQEYQNKLPFPAPGYLSNPGIEPASPALAGRFFTTVPPGKTSQKRRGESFSIFERRILGQWSYTSTCLWKCSWKHSLTNKTKSTHTLWAYTIIQFSYTIQLYNSMNYTIHLTFNSIKC